MTVAKYKNIIFVKYQPLSVHSKITFVSTQIYNSRAICNSICKRLKREFLSKSAGCLSLGVEIPAVTMRFRCLGLYRIN
jgi:hypothetical protein